MLSKNSYINFGAWAGASTACQCWGTATQVLVGEARQLSPRSLTSEWLHPTHNSGELLVCLTFI